MATLFFESLNYLTAQVGVCVFLEATTFIAKGTTCVKFTYGSSKS